MSVQSQIWLLFLRWKTLAYYRNKSAVSGIYFSWNENQNYNKRSTTSRSSYRIHWIHMHPQRNQRIKDLQMFCNIACFEPQATYSCFVTGWSNHHRIHPNNRINYSDIKRKPMSLPPKLDGMGIPVLSNDLTSKIINQERQYRPNINSMIRKSKIKLLSCSIIKKV